MHLAKTNHIQLYRKESQEIGFHELKWTFKRFHLKNYVFSVFLFPFEHAKFVLNLKLVLACVRSGNFAWCCLRLVFQYMNEYKSAPS